MRINGVLAITALAACSGTGDTTIDLTHDACAPLTLVSAAASELQRDGMTDAQLLWRDRGAPALGLRADATLEVVFEQGAGAFFGLYDDEEGIIFINSRIEDESALAVVIAHELGHAFGLPHITDRTSVMNPGNLRVPPNDADQAALAALWGNCN